MKPQENYEKYLDASYCYGMTEGEGYVIPYGDSPLDHENVGENIYLEYHKQGKELRLYLHTVSDH